MFANRIEPPLPLFYTDHHAFPLPAGHKFPLAKYALLRQALASDARFALRPATLAGQADLLRVHDPAYVAAFCKGTLDPQVMRRIGFPWSPELVIRTLASAGATLAATESALTSGFGGTLAGGTHHAFRAAGSGFCVFNDLAIAIEWAREKLGLLRFAVVDCDVHQGDGTAAIFAHDPSVFTLSLHADRNFPFRKQHSSLDVGLPDDCDDHMYLDSLATSLEEVWRFQPQLVLYQSGVDGLKSDKLGHLCLTQNGLAQRDRLVIGATRSQAVPLVITLGGGYSDPISETVAAHAQTFKMALALCTSSR